MTSWRDHKKRFLASVHRTFEVPAVYLVHGGAAPIRQTVRVHLKNVTSTLLRMSDWTNGAADMIESDRIKFDWEQLGAKLPAKGGFVVISTEEAYRIGPCEPPREGYVIAEVVRMSNADLAALLATQTTTLPAWEGVV
jgi:hypothetical protein